MNALIRKEVRLLFPLWSVALVLFATPAVLSRMDAAPGASILLMAGAAIPFVMALGTFGREFSNGTFAGLMALPVSRSRLWWIKIIVLAGALLSIGCVWWVSFSVSAERWPTLKSALTEAEITPLSSGLLLLAAFSGGLWTTLLFRQMAAAVWFTILIPILLLMGAGAIAERFTDEPNHLRRVAVVVLSIYGIAGFLGAWRLFLRTEDAQWTGGVIALPRLEIPFWRARTGSILRAHRPIAALLRKELQLHHASLLIAGLLFFIHIGIIALRTYGGEFTKQPVVADVLAVFWGLWLIMPLLIGATAVAEERKLGVAEAQLGQPIGWRRQLFVKILVVLALGVLLGAIPSWALERGQHLPSFFGPAGSSEPGGALVTLALLSAFIAMTALYASTLSRNTLQAVGVAVVLLVLGNCLLVVLDRPDLWIGGVLWQGDLGLVIGWPVMLLAGAWLLWGNFKRPQIGWREWKHNLVTLAVAVGFVVTSASALYHRVWELLTRIESPHGTARFAATESYTLRHDGGLALLGANGSLDVFRQSFAIRGRSRVIWRNYGLGSLTWSRQSLGTHWRSAASGHFDVVAIRDDGSLWVSEAPTPYIVRASEAPPPVFDLERFGLETNWRQVVRDPREGRSFFLLKNDGTLWRWRDTNRFPAKLPMAQIEPHQIGTDSDWAKLWAAGPRFYLTKSDGRAWGYNTLLRSTGRNSPELEPGLPVEPMNEFSGVEWRSVTGLSMFDLRVRPDGTLWAVGVLNWNRRRSVEQLGESSDWKAVSGNHNSAVALKEDGSLWKLDLGNWNTKPTLRRLSQYSDWIAVTSSHDEHFAFAADGSIWSWEARTPYVEYQTASFKLPVIELAPSRIPRRIGTID
jgi:hypothetical protein